MATKRPVAATIDDYIAAFPPEVQAVLQQVRQAVRDAAPQAEEAISYQIPTYRQEGVLVYFAAFKNHVGFYPPVEGDAGLEAAVARYAGPKGNLRFPLDEPMPLELIGRLTRQRLARNLSRRRAGGRTTATPLPACDDEGPTAARQEPHDPRPS